MFNKDLLPRIAGAAAVAILMIGATLLSQWGFCAVLGAIVLCSSYEFLRMSQVRGYSPQMVVGIVASLTVVIIGIDGFYNQSALNLPLTLFLILLVPSIFILEIFRGGSRPMANIATTLLPMLYIAAPMAMLSDIPLLISGGEWMPMVVVAYLFIVWASDSFAYFVGVAIGRHKIAPSISPKKTWEGFFGGMLGALIVAVVASQYIVGECIMWIGVAVIISITGLLGDLVESTFKRSSGVKDSGHIIPGHGGFLDRFDALILSSPFVFVYLLIIELLNN